MKLVDILARELAEWPVKEGVYPPSQDYCAQSDEYSQVFFCEPHGVILLSQRADKTSGVRVTRAEWQAAVDALNATKFVEWDGDGLPPIGVDCEVENEVLGGWDRAEKILAHSSINGKDVAVFQRGDLIAYARDGSFRPIRTAEQVDAEERENAIKEMMQHGVDAGDSTIEYSCAALYDAGWRRSNES